MAKTDLSWLDDDSADLTPEIKPIKKAATSIDNTKTKIVRNTKKETTMTAKTTRAAKTSAVTAKAKAPRKARASSASTGREVIRVNGVLINGVVRAVKFIKSARGFLCRTKGMPALNIVEQDGRFSVNAKVRNAKTGKFDLVSVVEAAKAPSRAFAQAAKVVWA